MLVTSRVTAVAASHEVHCHSHSELLANQKFLTLDFSGIILHAVVHLLSLPIFVEVQSQVLTSLI